MIAAVSRSSGVHSMCASCHRLARRNHRELREAVHEVRAPVFEIGRVAVLLDLRAVLKADPRHVGGFDRRDAAAACQQRFGEFAGVAAQRADRAHPGDRDASHRYWPAGPSAFFGGDQFLHSGAHVADVAHAAHFVVGNADIELVFESEQDLDGIHRIDSQLLELAIDGHGFEGNALGGGDTFVTRWIRSSDI